MDRGWRVATYLSTKNRSLVSVVQHFIVLITNVKSQALDLQQDAKVKQQCFAQ